LVNCPNENVQKQVLRNLVLMVDVQENLQTFRENFGIDILFELLHCLHERLRPLTFRILDKLLDKLSNEELERVFNFIAYEKRQFLEMKYELFEIIMKHVLYDPNFVESLKAIGGVSLLISLLDLPSEKIRVVILKIVAMLISLSPSQSRVTMNKIVGFDTMWLYLAPFPLSSEVCDTILGLGLGTFKCEHQRKKVPTKEVTAENHIASYSNESMTSVSSEGSEKGGEEFIFPEALYLLLSLLKNNDDQDVAFRSLTDVKRILSAKKYGNFVGTSLVGLDWHIFSGKKHD